MSSVGAGLDPSRHAACSGDDGPSPHGISPLVREECYAAVSTSRGMTEYRYLRADDSKDECAPRQVAIGTLILRRMRDVMFERASTRSTWPARTRQFCDSDEGTNKTNVKEDQEPAEPIGCFRSERELYDGCQDSVCDCGREDALDCSCGVVDALVQLENLVHSAGEDTKRDDGGQKLEDACEAEPNLIKG